MSNFMKTIPAIEIDGVSHTPEALKAVGTVLGQLDALSIEGRAMVIREIRDCYCQCGRTLTEGKHCECGEVAECDRLKAQYKEEYKTVARVWRALGITTYEGARGCEISELVEKQVTNCRHWRQECGKLHLKIKIMTDEAAAFRARIQKLEGPPSKADAQRWTREAQEPVMAELEIARQARDAAEAKGRWLDRVQASTCASELALALPPDVLMHPMPFPDRLGYAENMIQAAFERWKQNES